MKRTFPSRTSTSRVDVVATAMMQSGVAGASAPTQRAILGDGGGWYSNFDQWGRGTP